MYNRQSWPQTIALYSQADDTDALVTAAQYPAGALPLNGALTSGGNYVNGKPGFVTITSNGNDTTTTFTFAGKDIAGRTYIYSTTGPNNTIKTIQVPFYMLLEDSITINQTSVGTISLGVSSQTATPWIPFDPQRTTFSDGVNVTVSSGASLNYTVEYTEDDALRHVPVNIFADTVLANQTASGSSAINVATYYGRLRYNSWTSGSTVSEWVVAGSYDSFKNY